MLICSMYDNILSVKAPFIMDLFSFAQADVEHYSSQISYIPNNGLDDAVYTVIKDKYLRRMTYDSIKKSYKTFIRLLFVSDNEDCEKNIYGLYVFTYALTNYITKNGYIQIFDEEDVLSIFSKIKVDLLKESESRRNALIAITVYFPVVMDMFRRNYSSVFDYTSNCVLLNPRGLDKYRIFHTRTEKSAYAFFIENDKLKQACYTETLYNALKDCDDFDVSEFMKEMVSHIPSFNGFYDADVFMSSFISHLAELSKESIEEVMKIYKRNNQCTNRGRHASDMAVVNKYLEEHQSTENE